MTWLSDALSTLADLCKRACSADDLVKIIEERDSRLLLIPDGAGSVKLQREDREQPQRRHTFTRVDDLIRYLGTDDDAPSVWVDHSAVYALFCHHDSLFHFHQGFVDLEPHPLVAWLSRPQTLSQAEFKTAIRTVLHDALPDPAGLLKTVASLQFYTNEQGRNEHGHSKATFDRSIDAGISSGAGELPETLLLSFCPILESCVSPHRVNVALVTEPGKPVFSLIPQGRDLADAYDSALDQITAHLRNELSALVYRGNPRAGGWAPCGAGDELD